MTTITIKQYGDVVYYLQDGFKKGFIIKTLVISDDIQKMNIKYNVHTDIRSESRDYSPFRGYEKSPETIWDSYEEMLNHFKENPPK